MLGLTRRRTFSSFIFDGSFLGRSMFPALKSTTDSDEDGSPQHHFPSLSGPTSSTADCLGEAPMLSEWGKHIMKAKRDPGLRRDLVRLHSPDAKLRL